MEHRCADQRRAAGHRVWAARSVFRHGAVQKHGELSGAAPPGGGFAVFPAFCGGKSRRHLLYAADAGRVRYMRRHCKHGGRADGRYGGQRGHVARRNQRGHRKRGFSRVHPAVARDDFGQPVHYRAFLYPDHDGV